jgi:hypothetical protein
VETSTARQHGWIGRLLVVAASAVAFSVAPAVTPGTALGAAPGTAAAAEPAARPPVPAVQPAPPPDRGDPSPRPAPSGQAGVRAAEDARAAARAAGLARAGQRARATWEARGRPARLLVVRSTSVDLITEGRLSRRAPRTAGDLTLPRLSRYVPASWLSISDGTARLAAAVVLTPGTTLDVGGDVRRLELAGGAGLPDAAALHTGSGRLVLRGVTVTSVDRVSGAPLPASAGRPFVVVSSGGRLEALDTTLSDLGTSEAGDAVRPGVQFNTGSSGSLVRTTVARSSGPLQLSGSQGVRLQDVTVTESADDGLRLDDDRGTVLSGVRAVRNRGDGVHVTGADLDYAVTGITAAENGRFGIAATRLSGSRITGVRTFGNAYGGVELSQADGVTVAELTATDDPIGVYTHIGSTRIVLERLAITGGRRGVAVEKTTKDLVVQASTIDRATVVGIIVGGSDVELRDVSVSHSRTDVRAERGADGLTAVGLRVTGGQDGVVVSPGATRVVLHDLTAYGVQNDAVRSFSPDTRILGGTITGATTGINVAAPTTISGTVINLVDNGIRTRSAGLVQADDVQVDAIEVGIDAGPGSPLVITRSSVHALESVRGEVQGGSNDLSLPPLNLLGAIGIPLVLLALVLQHIHLARQGRAGEPAHRRSPPPAVIPRAGDRGRAAHPAGPTDEGRSGADTADRDAVCASRG